MYINLCKGKNFSSKVILVADFCSFTKISTKNLSTSFPNANKKANTCFAAERNKLFNIRFYTLNANIPSKDNYVKI